MFSPNERMNIVNNLNDYFKNLKPDLRFNITAGGMNDEIKYKGKSYMSVKVTIDLSTVSTEGDLYLPYGVSESIRAMFVDNDLYVLTGKKTVDSSTYELIYYCMTDFDNVFSDNVKDYVCAFYSFIYDIFWREHFEMKYNETDNAVYFWIKDNDEVDFRGYKGLDYKDCDTFINECEMVDIKLSIDFMQMEERGGVNGYVYKITANL